MLTDPSALKASKHYAFKPKWYFILLTLFFCALFIRLGLWQLHRADQTQQLLTHFNQRIQAAPVAIDQLPTQEINYYPIRLTGHYDNTHTVLLDNKIHEHQIGYEVITPFITRGPQQLLVNRGWIPAGNRRNTLPTIEPIVGKRTIWGSVYVSPGKPFLLGPIFEDDKTAPIRIQAIDFNTMQHWLNAPLYPFVLWLSPEVKEGYVRDWRPISMTPQKNMSYAMQWFAFAGVLVIIFFALNFRGNSSALPGSADGPSANRP